jgi:hypothetical protein
MIDMQYTEEEIKEEKENERIEEINSVNHEAIEVAQVYTGEIGPNEICPEAVVVNMNERSSLCENEKKGMTFCLFFFAFIAFIFFIVYILTPRE